MQQTAGARASKQQQTKAAEQSTAALHTKTKRPLWPDGL
jgi:hypothetical protein